MYDHLVRFVATGLYSGYGRPYPGTWGTIPAWLIGWFLLKDNLSALMIVTAVTFILSVWSAGAAEKFLGHDSRTIVIDEWIGMFIAVLLIPPTFYWWLAAFVGFRLFDVIKIPPARQLERLPGGWGVTMDDVVAGIQTNLVLQIVIYLYPQLA